MIISAVFCISRRCILSLLCSSLAHTAKTASDILDISKNTMGVSSFDKHQRLYFWFVLHTFKHDSGLVSFKVKAIESRLKQEDKNQCAIQICNILAYIKLNPFMQELPKANFSNNINSMDSFISQFNMEYSFPFIFKLSLQIPQIHTQTIVITAIQQSASARIGRYEKLEYPCAVVRWVFIIYRSAWFIIDSGIIDLVSATDARPQKYESFFRYFVPTIVWVQEPLLTANNTQYASIACSPNINSMGLFIIIIFGNISNRQDQFQVCQTISQGCIKNGKHSGRLVIIKVFVIKYHIIEIKNMNSTSKLPYKVKFDPEYQQYNQRMSRLPIPPATDGNFQVGDQLLQLVENVREKLKDQDLEFYPSNIYSQYASVNQLQQGKKKAAENCPACGQETKKQVQCEFCAVMYCKNCCWRKRVLPNLSEPKQSRLECQECHAKFVKLFANQKFYQESAIIQKIIDASNSKLRKLEKQVKTKKQKVEISERKKKECKIKQGILLKQLKNEQKKVQELQQKLQQVVKAKADKLRKQQQQKDEKKRTQQQMEAQRKRKQKQIEESIRKQKQLEAEQERVRKLQQETERYLKQQEALAQIERQKQKQMEQKRRMEEEEARKNRQSNLKRLLSEQKHRHDTDQLRSLAMNLVKDHEHHQVQPDIEGPPIVMAISQDSKTNQKQSREQVQEPAPQLFVTNSSPVKDQAVSSKVQESPVVLLSESKQVNGEASSPLKVLSSFNLTSEAPELQIKKSMGSSKTSESVAKATNEKQKTQMTESTQKGGDNLEQSSKKDESSQQKPFESLPAIAINVSEMTVNQLLGIHINPNAGMNQSRRLSQRESYLKEDKSMAQKKKQILTQTPEQQPQINQITQQQKYEILRSSNMSASLLHSNHQQTQELHEHPDPTGNKCNCNIM